MKDECTGQKKDGDDCQRPVAGPGLRCWQHPLTVKREIYATPRKDFLKTLEEDPPKLCPGSCGAEYQHYDYEHYEENYEKVMTIMGKPIKALPITIIPEYPNPDPKISTNIPHPDSDHTSYYDGTNTPNPTDDIINFWTKIINWIKSIFKKN